MQQFVFLVKVFCEAQGEGVAVLPFQLTSEKWVAKMGKTKVIKRARRKRRMKLEFIEARDLPDAWFQCVYRLLEAGREYS